MTVVSLSPPKQVVVLGKPIQSRQECLLRPGILPVAAKHTHERRDEGGKQDQVGVRHDGLCCSRYAPPALEEVVGRGLLIPKLVPPPCALRAGGQEDDYLRVITLHVCCQSCTSPQPLAGLGDRSDWIIWTVADVGLTDVFSPHGQRQTQHVMSTRTQGPRKSILGLQGPICCTVDGRLMSDPASVTV